MLGISFDQGFDECGLADARRSNDGDDDGGSFFGQAVDEGDMEAFFFDLDLYKLNVVSQSLAIHTSCERTACFANRPGCA